MLWDVIYHFFIENVFGGRTSTLYVAADYGAFYENSNWVNKNSMNTFVDIFNTQMPLGNYFSFVATIITMVAILLFCVFIIKKIIGVIFRLFTFGA